MSEPTMPSGTAAALTEAVEGLAEEVKGLRSDVRDLKGDLGSRTKRLWLATLAVCLVGATALSLVIANLIGAVGDIQVSQAQLAEQQEQLREARDASCLVFAGIGHPALLSPTSGPLAREIVGNSESAARIMGCVDD